MHRPATLMLLGCCLLLLLAACGATRPSYFYLLTPLEQTDAARQNGYPGVVVGPVTLPEYLQRPQIVRRNRANEIGFDEFHRWAEPLQANFSRVVAENLSLLLNSSRITLYPGYRATQLSYQVVIEVVRMEAGPDRRVELVARWSLLERRNKRLVTSRKSTIIEPVDGNSHRALVAAQSRTVSRLSGEIAEAIRISRTQQRPDSPAVSSSEHDR